MAPKGRGAKVKAATAAAAAATRRTPITTSTAAGVVASDLNSNAACTPEVGSNNPRTYNGNIKESTVPDLFKKRNPATAAKNTTQTPPIPASQGVGNLAAKGARPKQHALQSPLPVPATVTTSLTEISGTPHEVETDDELAELCQAVGEVRVSPKVNTNSSQTTKDAVLSLTPEVLCAPDASVRSGGALQVTKKYPNNSLDKNKETDSVMVSANDVESVCSGGQFYSMSDVSSMSEGEKGNEIDRLSFSGDWAEDGNLSFEEDVLNLDSAVNVDPLGTVHKVPELQNSLSTARPSLVEQPHWDGVSGLQDNQGEVLDNNELEPEGEITLKSIYKLQSSIYKIIMVHREETKAEGLGTQGAVRKLQNAVRRIAKSCTEATTRVQEAEDRISTVEDELSIQKSSINVLQKTGQDIDCKLTDLENRARRINLRILGIPEGSEGKDARRFIVELFTAAFPDLKDWDWEKEIIRNHRFSFTQRRDAGGDSGKPRAILICLHNYLLQEILYDQARPACPRKGIGCEFFVRTFAR